MKKIAILTFFLLVLSAGSAFSATIAWSEGPVTLGTGDTVDVQLSSSVSMYYGTDAAGLGYLIGTSHSSGTRSYGSSSGNAKIFWIDGKQTTMTGLTVPTGTGSVDYSSWNEL